ncbi:BRO family protein [Aeromonas hydrophila]|uniref:BRO family protein n=1 Tax=Aeromonas hydrophila TaxID=644 RepID=UPI0009553E97|nr:BRO family protein [Aeromonas hydrophila]SIR16788.1 Meiotically up-regulated gene 113 [Aeromonas hydrophila]SIR16870.1 Meiotically up-regulated gene 113 [Aeromonas hydrophila]
MQVLSFDSEEFGKVRLIQEDGRVLVCAADVCSSLGYANARDAVRRHCDDEDQAKRVIETSSGEQLMTFLNERALFSLAIRSKLPWAKEFQAWLVDEVLGSFKATNAILTALADFDVPDGLDDMSVYAIQNTATGSIKLGISRDPLARLKHLQTACEHELRLVGVRDAKNHFADERALHLMNSDCRLIGEWFHCEDRLDAMFGSAVVEA